ncbi:MAG: hypothetical protein Q8Q44_20825, partial [Nocardioides sp.]|nr:hypothetical protein [Nocardioides sp.]
MTQTPVPKPPTRPKRPAPAAPQPAPAPAAPAWQSPNLGLARPKPGPGPKVEGRAGSLGKHSAERGFSTDSSGAVNGVKSEVEHVVGAGAEGSISTESSSFDGSTLTETSTKVEGMAGATAAYKRVHVANDQELSVAVETLARAGAFGKAEQKAALQRGVLSLKESSSIEGNVGVEAKLAAEAKVDRSGVIPALLVTLETGIKAGVWVDGQFDAEARVGPLALAVMAKINAMAGVEAQFSSKAFANLRDGVGAEFEASGFAGAK